MDPLDPKLLAAKLSQAQRDIMLSGPDSFAEADTLPEGLFEMDVSWDRETGDESVFWEITERGRKVRDLLD